MKKTRTKKPELATRDDVLSLAGEIHRLTKAMDELEHRILSTKDAATRAEGVTRDCIGLLKPIAEMIDRETRNKKSAEQEAYLAGHKNGRWDVWRNRTHRPWEDE